LVTDYQGDALLPPPSKRGEDAPGAGKVEGTLTFPDGEGGTRTLPLKDVKPSDLAPALEPVVGRFPRSRGRTKH
jgi:hypothetical protein